MSGLNRKIEEVLSFEVYKEDRLDRYLAESCPDLSRSYIQELIKEGFVLINGEVIIKPSKKVKPGDTITFYVPEPEPLEVRPENIPIEVIYEDEDIALIVKPCGLVVHPSPGYTSGTLVNALLYHFKELSQDAIRPGIVHRLDKNTMGLMVVAKRDIAHRKLSEEFKERRVMKFYKALVKGRTKEYGIVDTPIGRHPTQRLKFTVRYDGKPALTEFWLLEYFEKYDVSLLDVRIHTGRTHQIRVHLSSLGHPILGDYTYGFKKNYLPQKFIDLMGDCHMLISYRLAFNHPTKERWMDVSLPELPEPFKNLLDLLKEGNKQGP
ncbi:RluA family pseudouridine synthase [Thermocrinis minervae]|uniref:Pseudouridine synthase n=1 Tax=Thermocrinis minervae TaxID=381751 RepID=A0A1M6SEF7_9AQUI|nr:RluA family pseudouridine synthase [Thermocrinis minervae]SHK43123.1 23S rRNA pseudouridine1911/1915/1917 synthase [Thermocrinis minervae]